MRRTKAWLRLVRSRATALAPPYREKHWQLDTLRTLVSHLTPRERQVFERVVRGKLNKEIARELGATERTIKAHRHRVMEKLTAASLAGLVMIAERLGILAGEDCRHRITHRPRDYRAAGF